MKLRIASGHKDDTLNARLARGASSASMVQIVGVAVAFLAQLVLTRSLGASEYGIYAYVFAWVSVLTFFSTLGFATALLRFVATYRAKDEWALLRGVIRYAERRVLLAATAVALISVGIVLAWPGGLRQQLVQTFVIGMVVVPSWALLRVRSAVVRGFGGVVSALAPDRAVREATIIVLMVLATFGTSWTIDAPIGMTATVIGTLVGLSLVTMMGHRMRPAGFGGVPPADASREWRAVALPLLVMTGMQILMNRLGVVMIGWMMHTTDAGVYALASQISELAIFPQTAVNVLFAPTAAALHARGDHRALQNVVTTTAWWTLVGALIVTIPILLFLVPVLSLFGEAFVEGAMSVRILLIGKVVSAASGLLLFLLAMTGHERHAAFMVVMGTLVNFALNAALIGPFGLEGAALSLTLTLIVWNGMMALFVWQRLGLVPGVLGTLRRSS